MSYQRALDFLLSRIDYERATLIPYRRREFRLDRMRRLLEMLGDPHRGLNIVHVAGTKGKGSTATMIAAILSAAGYKTGLYTSPHLERVEERVAIDSQPCTPEQFVQLIETLRPVVAELEAELRRDDPNAAMGPTYFEITTAMAILHFAEQKVDAAVLEVGLGGRLDSTNVVTPLVSVITSISYDHMKQLGPTLRHIAKEKAGIVKPGVPVVSGVVEDEPRIAIEEVCTATGSPLRLLGRDFWYEYLPPSIKLDAVPRGRMDFHIRLPNSHRDWADLELGLLGRHQASNAAVALATTVELQHSGWAVPEAAIRRGMVDARCPARVEVIGQRPTIVLDTAHNRASVASLLETIDESFPPGPRLLIFATTQDKQVREMLELLLPRFEHVLLTRYTSNPRGFPLDELAQLAAEISGRQFETAPTPEAAWARAGELTTPEQLICVTGSFFLAAEIRRLLAAPDTLDARGN